MSLNQLPPDAKDVEALLLSDIFMSDEQTCIPDSAAREVTMRGDLEQMHLADIFQSLGMSKMEGVLRIRNLVECREVYFQDGFIRCFMPSRVEVRRLGVQLIQAGLVTPSQLRAILVEQRRGGQALRELLISNEILPEDDVRDLFSHQAGEDIYSLFAWTAGTFEFYKGPPSDEAAVERLNASTRFDINAVLMEVARRSDEWELIQQTLLSIDELLAHSSKSADDLKGDHREIYHAVDGQRPVRVLAQSMLVGLFEVCRVLGDLVRKGYLRFVTIEEGLAVATRLAAADQKTLAIALLQTLAARPQGVACDDLAAIARVLAEADAAPLAARTLLAAADASDDPGTAIPLLREALALQPRSLDVLMRLRASLQQHPVHANRNEIKQITDALVDACVAEQRFDDALIALLEMDHLSPGDPRTVFRRAIVLHRAGRRDDAINALLALAETFKAQRAREQLAAVYDQILKIDSHRRDIQRARRALRLSAAGRRVRIAAIAVLAFGLGTGGVMVYRGAQARRNLTEAMQTVEQSLAANDANGAARAVDAVEEREGAIPELEAMRARIQAHLADQQAAARRKLDSARNEVLGQAARQIEGADFAGALSTYAQLAASGQAGDEENARAAARLRLDALATELNELAQRLPSSLPPPPDSLQNSDARRRAIERIDEQFTATDRKRAAGIAQALESDVSKNLVEADLIEKLRRTCTTIEDHYQVAEARRTAYAQVETRAESARRLQPLLVEAREHEAAFRFKPALDAFRTLAREHTGDDQLKSMFLDRVEANAKLVRLIELLEQATANGDFAAAQGQLRALRKSRPEVPFERLVQLPLLVTSVPPGARVSAGEEAQALGVTPLKITYTPGNVTLLRIELPGFGAETARVSGDAVGEVRATLTKLPAWSVECAGPVTHAPASFGHTVLVVDRAGNLAAHESATGRQLWRVQTGDLSGLLPRPAVTAKQVLVASVDGTLRCFALDTGRALWERENVPAEVGPVLHEGVAILATADSRLVGLDVATGRPRFEQPLRRAASGALLLLGARVYFASADGDVVCANATDGRELWRASLGQLVVVPPVAVGNRIVVVGDEGKVAAFDANNGRTSWSQTISSLLSVSPAVCGGSIFVASDTAVIGLDPATGQRLSSITVDATSSLLAAAGDRLLVGSTKGTILCIDSQRGVILTRMFGPGRVTVATSIPDGVLVGFDGKTVQAYQDLP